MYQVAIVEDQEFIADAIAQMISAEENSFKICGVYYNARDCIHNIRANPPDIVITDIRMPGMDGIQLSKWLTENYPSIKIIILSGYEDFNYAREAIQIGVCSYLLKPCPPDMMFRCLEETVEKIEAERKNNEIIQKYEALFVDNLPSLKQQALISAMFSEGKRLSPDKLGLEYLAGKSHLFLVDAGIREEDCNSQESELFLFSCGNMLEELLGPLRHKEFFICNGQFVLLVPVDEALPDKPRICLQNACKKVHDIVHRNILFYDGGILKSLDNLRPSYKAVLEKSKENYLPQNNSEDAGSEVQSVLEQAKQYIHENYYRDISLQDVANVTYVSYNYLSSLFTQNLGINFSVYLSKIRIEKACELLKDPDHKVAEVAEKTGYSNYRYFNYVFKKMTGYTPSEFRRLR